MKSPFYKNFHWKKRGGQNFFRNSVKIFSQLSEKQVYGSCVEGFLTGRNSLKRIFRILDTVP